MKRPSMLMLIFVPVLASGGGCASWQKLPPGTSRRLPPAGNESAQWGPSHDAEIDRAKAGFPRISDLPEHKRPL